MSTIIEHNGIWRIMGQWKDTGGIDGQRFIIDMEWYDPSCAMYHTAESWTEEKHRAIPGHILEWASEVYAFMAAITPSPSMWIGEQ